MAEDSWPDRCLLCLDDFNNDKRRVHRHRRFISLNNTTHPTCNIAQIKFGMQKILVEAPDMNLVEQGRRIFLENIPTESYGHGVYGISDWSSSLNQLAEDKKKRINCYCTSFDRRMYNNKNQRSPLLDMDVNFTDDNREVEGCYRTGYIGTTKNIENRPPEHINESILVSACPDVSLKTAFIYSAATNCRCFDFRNFRLNSTKPDTCKCIRFTLINFDGKTSFSYADAIYLESFVANLLGLFHLTNRQLYKYIPEWVNDENLPALKAFVAFSIKKSFASDDYIASHLWQFKGRQNFESILHMGVAINNLEKSNISRGDMYRVLSSTTPVEFLERLLVLNPLKYAGYDTTAKTKFVQNFLPNKLIDFLQNLNNIPVNSQQNAVQEVEEDVEEEIEQVVLDPNQYIASMINDAININTVPHVDVDHTIPTVSHTVPHVDVDHTIPTVSHPTVPDHTIDTVPDHTTPTVPDHTIDTVPDHTTPTVPDHISHTVPDHTIHTVPDHISHTVPDHTIHTVPDHTSTTPLVDSIISTVRLVDPLQPLDVIEISSDDEQPQDVIELSSDEDMPMEIDVVDVNQGYNGPLGGFNHPLFHLVPSLESNHVIPLQNNIQDFNNINHIPLRENFQSNNNNQAEKCILHRKSIVFNYDSDEDNTTETPENYNRHPDINVSNFCVLDRFRFNNIADDDLHPETDAEMHQFDEELTDQELDEELEESAEEDLEESIEEDLEEDLEESIEEDLEESIEEDLEDSIEDEIDEDAMEIDMDEQQQVNPFIIDTSSRLNSTVDLRNGDTTFHIKNDNFIQTATYMNYYKVFTGYLKTVDNKYLCPYCQVKPCDLTNLYIHIKDVHGVHHDEREERVICPICECPLSPELNTYGIGKHKSYCRKDNWYSKVVYKSAFFKDD